MFSFGRIDLLKGKETESESFWHLDAAFLPKDLRAHCYCPHLSARLWLLFSNRVFTFEVPSFCCCQLEIPLVAGKPERSQLIEGTQNLGSFESFGY